MKEAHENYLRNGEDRLEYLQILNDNLPELLRMAEAGSKLRGMVNHDFRSERPNYLNEAIDEYDAALEPKVG